MESLNKATIVDGIAATEGRDSQGEVLKLAGADISEMTTKGYWNDNHNSGFLNTLGKITEAKKIFSEGDCENARHRMFWNQVHKPYLYVKAYLFDTEGDHPNAKAVGAIMRSFAKEGTPLDVKFSVEGKVLDRAAHDRTILQQSMVRNVALTLVPANKETAAAIAGDTNAVHKAMLDAGADTVFATAMAKSLAAGLDYPVSHYWEESSTEDGIATLMRKAGELKQLALELRKGGGRIVQDPVAKMTSPGYGGAGAPGQLAGGAALVRKDTFAHRQALKEVLKTVLAGSPGLSLTKTLEMVLRKFKDRFAKDELAPMVSGAGGGASSTAPAPAPPPPADPGHVGTGPGTPAPTVHTAGQTMGSGG